jgi:hypothetical protein
MLRDVLQASAVRMFSLFGLPGVIGEQATSYPRHTDEVENNSPVKGLLTYFVNSGTPLRTWFLEDGRLLGCNAV